MLCKTLERLKRILKDVGNPYDVVEYFLDYPRHRESLASMEISRRVSCDKICKELDSIKERIENSKVCVLLPGFSELKVPDDCSNVVVAETASSFLLDMGFKALAVVTDLDADIGLLSLYPYIADYLIIHIHGDNLDKVLQFVRKAGRSIYTSQIEGIDCILGPFGFTDGDRAVLLPMLFGAKEVDVHGFYLLSPKGKRYYTMEKMIKIRLGYLIVHYYASRLGYKITDKDPMSLVKM